MIFGLENRQRLFSLQLSNGRVLMKLIPALSLWQPSAADDVKRGLCEEDRILIFF